jgi:hypothetical protein
VPARYEGTVNGGTMNLSVTLPSGPPLHYLLTYATPGRFQCRCGNRVDARETKPHVAVSPHRHAVAAPVFLEHGRSRNPLQARAEEVLLPRCYQRGGLRTSSECPVAAVESRRFTGQ